MTSLEIINLALARLGAQQATSTSDTNKNPRLAIQAYPFARDEVLRFHPWPCIVSNAYAMDDTDLKWVVATAYDAGDYVVNSSRLYLCTTAGTSAASPATGPATKSDAITDGTAVWEYVSDYTDIIWRASTVYAAGARVVNSGRLYLCSTAGTSNTSGGPTTTASAITDGTAKWDFIAEYDNHTDYTYQYLVPTSCLRILEVGDKAEYLRQGPFIYTDTEFPVIRYVRASESPNEWDNFIQEAIALRTAQMVCEAITGSAGMAQMLQQEYLQVLTMGMGIAQGEASEEPEHETRWEEV